MKRELDEYLCKVYPKMMVNRDKDMTETCMCWGFEVGRGWFQILNQLMGNIQNHIDWSIHNRDIAIAYNEMITQCKAGDYTLFEERYKDIKPENQEWKAKHLKDIIEGDLRTLPDVVPQVTLDQVKEKFGTLRFYYSGGDDVIDGMVRMAESMSSVTCEECGKPGTSTGGGWIKTVCVEHGGEDYDTPEEELNDAT